MDTHSRPASAMSSWQYNAATQQRPTSALSVSFQSQPPATLVGSFRPASAASNVTFVSTSSKLREATAARYSPTIAEELYDHNPPIGIFRNQLKRNGWFLKNQRAPSQLRIGKPICTEIPVPARLLHLSPQHTKGSPTRGGNGRPPSALSMTALSRPSSAFGGSQSHTAAINSSVSRRLRLQVQTNRSGSALSRGSMTSAGTAMSRPPEPKVPFGTMIEDSVGMVAGLTRWAPPQQDAKPESLPSHYRTTTKHGSTAHTIWDFIWETPVLRSDRIKQEIQLPESS
jgi:hypothetical protein